MKKIMMSLMLLVAVTVNAQMISWDDHMYLGINGYKYDRGDIPGGAWMATGDNVMTEVNAYFMRLRHDDYKAYVREYNAFTMRGGLAGIQPVGPLSVNYGGMNGMMMGNVYGGGMGMVGYGMQNSGMVAGAMGMAGATSNVVIDNSNLAETIGSGMTMNYDGHSLSFSGDPVTALLRTVSAIGSKTKKSSRQQVVYQQPVQQQTYSGYANGQILQDAQGNQYVMKNGVLVPVQTRSAQPTQNVRTVQSNGGQMTSNVSTGQLVRQSNQPTQTTQTTTTNTNNYRNNGNGFVSGF